MLFFVWLIVALTFFILELVSVSLFYFLSCAFAGIITALSALIVFCWVYQVVIFCVSALMCFIILKHLFGKPGSTLHVTNVDALVGKRAQVIKSIAPGHVGQVKIGGQVWSAKAVGTHVIVEGAWVEVVRIQGSHAIVKEVH